jgi:hypothetical protein
MSNFKRRSLCFFPRQRRDVDNPVAGGHGFLIPHTSAANLLP